jgi:hypothetical protein
MKFFIFLLISNIILLNIILVIQHYIIILILKQLLQSPFELFAIDLKFNMAGIMKGKKFSLPQKPPIIRLI